MTVIRPLWPAFVKYIVALTRGSRPPRTRGEPGVPERARKRPFHSAVNQKTRRAFFSAGSALKRIRKGTLSKLSRSVVREGSTFEIAIHADGKGKWDLLVVDDLKIASTWIEPFDTEQSALEAALAAIEGDSDRSYVSELFAYRLH